MEPAFRNSPLFARQQISELTGLSDGVLSFWIKNRLLIPSRGGDGRGSHRKFTPIQVSFAAILGVLKQFGLNIGALRSFSAIFQRGADLCEGVDLHPLSLSDAAYLAIRLDAFRRGEPVEVRRYLDAPRSHDRVEIKLATTEEDIAEESLKYSEFDDASKTFSFAQSLTAEDFQSVQAYKVVRIETYGLDTADFGWLLWQESDGQWRISTQTERGEDFDCQPSSDTAIFIAVGQVLRRLWGFDLDQRRKRAHAQRVADLLQEDPGRLERWVAGGMRNEDDREMARLIKTEER